METIDEMRERHKQEIQNLQDMCEHPKTRWDNYVGIPGRSGKAKYCLICGKELENIPYKIEVSTTVSSSNDDKFIMYN